MISITEGLEMMNLERGIGLRFEKMRETTKKIAFILENSWIMVATGFCMKKMLGPEIQDIGKETRA